MVEWGEARRMRFMIAIDYQVVADKLDELCDKAAEGNDAVVVRRQGGKNVVMTSLEHYSELLKAKRNADYLEKIDGAIEQLESGGGTVHELIDNDTEGDE